MKEILIGTIWGLVSVPIYSRLNENDSELKKLLVKIISFPAYASTKSGMQDKYSFIGAPLIGIGTVYIAKFIKD